MKSRSHYCLALMLGLLPPTPPATAAGNCDANESYTLLIHGGIVEYAEEVEPRHIELIRRLVGEGRANLAQGGRALDVAVEAIVEMENSGIFDAGKGSIVNTAGVTETDASVMDGQTGESGAVAAMQRLKNPIRAARLVMESTGGWPGKLPGRVGDSPIVGASTFANRRFALSATGLGESFIKRGAIRDIAARAEYLQLPLQAAADYVVKELIGEQDRAAGAIIAIGVDGEVVLSSNAYGILFGHASNLTPVEAGSKLD